MQKVKFDNIVHTLLVLYEDRKGERMKYVIDRGHVKRQIQQK